MFVSERKVFRDNITASPKVSAVPKPPKLRIGWVNSGHQYSYVASTGQITVAEMEVHLRFSCK